MSTFLSILSICAPILIALIGIIPTIISNRKKTQEAIDELKRDIATHKQMNLQGCQKIQETLEAHIRENEETEARTTRYRILRFYDELCEGHVHSESHFEDIIEDIDRYETYCSNHKDFKNNRGTAAMEYIKKCYKEYKIQGRFPR